MQTLRLSLLVQMIRTSGLREGKSWMQLLVMVLHLCATTAAAAAAAPAVAAALCVSSITRNGHICNCGASLCMSI